MRRAVTLNEEGPLGLSFVDSPASYTVVSAEPAGQAAGSGVAPGDVLVAVNGRKTDPGGHAAHLELLRGAGRPVTLDLVTPQSAQERRRFYGEDGDELSWTAGAARVRFDAAGALGLALAQSPAGYPVVSRTDPEGQAAGRGVDVGDVLLSVGGTRSEALGFEAAKQALQQRPTVAEFLAPLTPEDREKYYGDDAPMPGAPGKQRELHFGHFLLLGLLVGGALFALVYLSLQQQRGAAFESWND